MHAYALSYPGIHTFNVYTCTHTHTHARTHTQSQSHSHLHPENHTHIHLHTPTYTTLCHFSPPFPARTRALRGSGRASFHVARQEIPPMHAEGHRLTAPQIPGQVRAEAN